MNCVDLKCIAGWENYSCKTYVGKIPYNTEFNAYDYLHCQQKDCHQIFPYCKNNWQCAKCLEINCENCCDDGVFDEYGRYDFLCKQCK